MSEVTADAIGILCDDIARHHDATIRIPLHATDDTVGAAAQLMGVSCGQDTAAILTRRRNLDLNCAENVESSWRPREDGKEDGR